MPVKSSANTCQAPVADEFPSFPVSWYLFGSTCEVNDSIQSREIFGRRVVVFRTETGKWVAMDARCSHLGSDLAHGCVIGERIQCPYHHWEYDISGHCAHIPAQLDIPAFARQRTFPVQERHGYLFVFNAPEPLFPLPFYEGCDPAEMTASQCMEQTLDCAWYLVGSNAFDLQHFKASHDRRLINTSTIEVLTPFSRRASARFSVSGNSLQDKLTRALAGNEVELSITDYCGNMLLAVATFRRTRSYGLVATEPLSGNRVRVRIIAFVPRSRNVILRALLDRVSASIRHEAICRFLSADGLRLNGASYNPQRFIEADRHLVEYFRWLAEVPRS
jgi:aminopyrrolnitrin oxygenase